MIWARAEGCRVTLDDGREVLDLTGGFGVAALGHRNPRILEAWCGQDVVHALGDLAEAAVTARLREALPWPAKLGVTGEDAVEIALRTAHLANGRPGIVAFEGAYHGTGLLALAATGFERFREPWRAWLPGPVHRQPYGEDPGPLPADTAAVIVEPVQGRAGSVVPPDGFLATLRRRCDAAGALLVIGCGFPTCVCVLACASALVVLDEVPRLLDHVVAMGERLELACWHGRGLLRAHTGSAEDALERGVLVVPAGLDGSLVQATPPLTITAAELDEALERLGQPRRA